MLYQAAPKGNDEITHHSIVGPFGNTDPKPSHKIASHSTLGNLGKDSTCGDLPTDPSPKIFNNSFSKSPNAPR